MKFNISSKAFYSAAAAVSKVISSKNALAILDNFLLSVDAENNILTITGSDQENALSARMRRSSPSRRTLKRITGAGYRGERK